MQCRDGYKSDSPLCAVCDKGHYMHMRDCHSCKSALRSAFFFLLLCALFGSLVLLCRLALRYQQLLSKATVMPHAKILISFVIVLVSVDVQFGVAWPARSAHTEH